MIGSSDYGPRGYMVELWGANKRAGNRHLFVVPLEASIDAKRAKALAKEAKHQFGARDKESFVRAAAEQQMSRE